MCHMSKALKDIFIDYKTKINFEEEGFFFPGTHSLLFQLMPGISQILSKFPRMLRIFYKVQRFFSRNQLSLNYLQDTHGHFFTSFIKNTASSLVH